MWRYYVESYLAKGEQKAQVREGGLDKFLYSSDRREQLLDQVEKMSYGGFSGSRIRIYPTLIDSKVDIVLLKPSRSLSDFFKTKKDKTSKIE